MLKRPLSESEREDSLAKQQRKDDVQVSDELRLIVQTLIERRNHSNFPAICLEAAHDKIAPLLNQQQKDTFGLPQQSSDGKNLVAVLLLAALCATQGLNDVQEQRAKGDLGRHFGSKDWVSWAKTKPSKDIRTTKWSMIKPFFETEPQQTQNTVDDDHLDERIVECFMDHEVMSCASNDIFDECAVCHSAYDQSKLKFYRCLECDIDLCACCEERRTNYQ